MRFTALLFVVALFAGCATHKDDPRLLGTWRTDLDASVAAAFKLEPNWTNAPPEKVKRFRSIIDTTYIYSSDEVGAALYKGVVYPFRYQVVKRGSNFVVVYRPDIGRDIRIRFMDGNTAYWIDAGPSSGYKLPMRYDKVFGRPNNALEPTATAP